MDAVLDAQFLRVETALNTLIESITSYNPSPQAATDLVAADDDLSKGLEQLAIHQANHAHILSLRQTTTVLDTQIKTTLRSLAETRKELLATPTTRFSKGARDVPFNELLSYAKYISRYTRPPTLRNEPEDPLKDTEHKDEDGGVIEATPKPANGIAQTPAVPDFTQTQTQPSALQTDVTQTTQATGTETGEKDKQHGLGPEMRSFLDAMSSAPWEPWPSHDIIRSGNLFAIQGMIDRGVDPAKILSPEEQEAEEKKRAEEEEQARKEKEERDAAEKLRRESMYQAARDRGQAQQERRPVEDTSGFGDGGLDLYDPDEE